MRSSRPWKYVASVLVVFGAFAFAPFAFALDTSAIPGGAGEQLVAASQGAGFEQQNVDLPVVIMRIVSVTLGLIGVVLVGLLVYAGWMYMTAGGESDKTEKAKTTIRNAIIGLAIILLSYAIARFVTNSLLKATGTS